MSERNLLELRNFEMSRVFERDVIMEEGIDSSKALGGSERERIHCCRE